jgi:hypothetical protein
MTRDLSSHAESPTWAAHPWVRRSLVLGLLLFALWLRSAALVPMSTTMLHHDEAFNAVDSLNLMMDFRLTPFLPGNFGRESGWVYWLMPFLVGLGGGLFAIRFASLITGFLTVVAVYRLGAELVPSRPGERVAIWAMGSIGVLYWHVHLSHLALRANLYLLAATLATALLLRAYRRNRPFLWAASGVGMGALIYTYFASVAWIGYLVAILFVLVLLDPTRRRGVLIAMGCLALVVAPMFGYAIAHPDRVMERSSAVSMIGWGVFGDNVRAWGRAFFQQGDSNVLFNLPNRPILESLSGLLALVGLIGMVANRRWRISGLLLLGLAVATLAPSLLSNFAPHFLRGSGFVIPLSLLLGLGGATLASFLVCLGWVAESRALPILLLLAIGIVTHRDFHGRWLHDPETFTAMEMHINQAANLVRERTSKDTYVYFSPFTPAHPVIIIRAQDLSPRPTSAFNSHDCWVVPDGPASYISLTLYEPSFAGELSRWAEISTLFEDQAIGVGRPRYTVYSAIPHNLTTNEPTARFADQFEVRLLEALPGAVAPGATVAITLGVRALRPAEIAPSLFLHLYTIPTPYEGGSMIAQADSQICTSYPAHLWREDETVIQTLQITVPEDVDEGNYLIGLGMYPFPDGPRLAVVAPEESVHDYVALHQLRVVR